MIRIARLRLKNFKSFRKANIPFHEGFTCIAGSNASGKCVVGDTKVYLSDGSAKRIDELVEAALAKSQQPEKMEDGCFTLANPENVEVACLNTCSLKMEPMPVRSFIKRTSPATLLKLTTKSGRSVTATAYHPVYSLQDGKLKALQAGELKAGTRIAVPRRLVKETPDGFFRELIEAVAEEDNLYAPNYGEYREIARKWLKENGLTQKAGAARTGIPYLALKSLLDGQAMKLAYLFRLLKAAGHEAKEIACLVPMAKGKTGAKEVVIPWHNSKKFARLLGYLFAEGRNSTNNQVWFTNGTPEIVEDYARLCRQTLGIEPFVKKYKPNAWDAILFSNPASLFLDKFGLCRGKRTKHKRLNEFFIRHASPEELAEFLNGLYCGDGYVTGNTVELTSASRELALSVQRLLLMLDIPGRLKQRTKHATNTGRSGIYWSVSVFGQENLRKFNEKIRLVHEAKRRTLESAVAEPRRIHSNVDLIPGLQGVIRETCQVLGSHPMRKTDRYPKLQAYARNLCEVSRHGLQEVIEREFAPLAVASPEKLAGLRLLAESDVLWDEIVSIEALESAEEWVYDLCIDEHHNFVADNVFVHNSNILDSILFALGATSLKMLRASRLTDLVNHDADEDYAKAELVLNENGQEIEVKRLIDKKGRGAVKLNGKKKSLDEVTAYLEELGLRASGHNIVVQGDITKIIEMNPKERRQIIDRVAGLQEFEEKKEEALKKLEKVEQKVREVGIVLKERELYLGELEKERALALKFEQLNTELKQSKATILALEIKKVKAELASAEKKRESLQKQIDRLAREKEGLAEEGRKAGEKLEELTRKLLEASQKTYSGIGREIEEKKAEARVLRERLAGLNQRLQQDSLALQQRVDQAKNLAKTAGERERELHTARDKLQGLSESLKQLQGLIEAKSKTVSAKSGALKAKEGQIEGLKARALEHKEALMGTHGEIAWAENLLASREHSIEAVEKENAALHKKLEEKGELLKRLRELEKRKDHEQALLKKEAELEKALEDISYSKNRIEGLHEEMAALQKAKTSCPVCENELTGERKDKLRAKKEREKDEFEARIQEKHALRVEIAREKDELRHTLNEIIKLRAQLEDVDELKKKLEDNRKRVLELTAELKKVDLPGLKAREKEQQHELERVERECSLAVKGLENMQESAENLAFNQLMEKFNEANAEHAERQERLLKLESELNNAREARERLGGEAKALEGQVKGFGEQRMENERALQGIEGELAEKQLEMEKSRQETGLMEQEKQRVSARVHAVAGEKGELEGRISGLERELNEFNLEQSRNEVRIVDLEEEFKPFASIELLKEAELPALRSRLPKIEAELDKIGAVNMKAIQSYEDYKKEVEDVRGKAAVLEGERKAVLEMIDKIEVKKLNVFMECFNKVSYFFGELYKSVFQKEGRLGLSDAVNPLAGGLLIQAKYKEDKMKSLDEMSGGEKSLTALAFLFAIQQYQPSPFYIFDEIDAALDKENSVRVGLMIQQVARKSQVISITHNDAVIKLADQLIGVALNKQKSSVVGLKLKGVLSAGGVLGGGEKPDEVSDEEGAEELSA